MTPKASTEECLITHSSGPPAGWRGGTVHVSLQKWQEVFGGDSEEPEALAGPSYDHVEADAEENGQHRQDCPVLDDEDDLHGDRQQA